MKTIFNYYMKIAEMRSFSAQMSLVSHSLYLWYPVNPTTSFSHSVWNSTDVALNVLFFHGLPQARTKEGCVG